MKSRSTSPPTCVPETAITPTVPGCSGARSSRRRAAFGQDLDYSMGYEFYLRLLSQGFRRRSCTGVLGSLSVPRGEQERS